MPSSKKEYKRFWIHENIHFQGGKKKYIWNSWKPKQQWLRNYTTLILHRKVKHFPPHDAVHSQSRMHYCPTQRRWKLVKHSPPTPYSALLSKYAMCTYAFGKAAIYFLLQRSDLICYPWQRSLVVFFPFCGITRQPLKIPQSNKISTR